MKEQNDRLNKHASAMSVTVQPTVAVQARFVTVDAGDLSWVLALARWMQKRKLIAIPAAVAPSERIIDRLQSAIDLAGVPQESGTVSTISTSHARSTTKDLIS